MKHKINVADNILQTSSIKSFLDTIPNLGNNTRKGYIKVINDFLDFINTHFTKEEFPSSIKQKVFIAWVNNLNSHYRKITIYNNIRIIARYLRFLKQSGVLKHNSVDLLLKRYPKRGLTGITNAFIGSSPQKALRYLMPLEKFISPFGKFIKQYLSLAKSQGKKFQNETETLDNFDRFLMSYKKIPSVLSNSIMVQWIATNRSCLPSTQYLYFIIVRRFCVYLHRFDSKSYIPSETLVQSKYPELLPYVYSKKEIVAILKAAQQLKPSNLSPIRAETYYLLILLLYTLGLRCGEVLKLELGDIDWTNQSLQIREGKCFKSRMVPISASVFQELKNYIQQRKAVGLSTESNSPLFQNPHRTGHLSKSVMTTTFTRILRQLNIKKVNGRRAPCIHSLRPPWLFIVLNNGTNVAQTYKLNCVY